MENVEYKQKLKSQIKDAYGRVVYTYTAHHKLANRLRNKMKWIKIIQIFLTSISTVGFLATVITNQAILSWLGGITAALSLGLNLYVKEFEYQKEITQHEAAANDLWDVRESYVSLISDFEIMKENELRCQRDELQKRVSEINHKYPGTDTKSYRKAQVALQEDEEQTFNEGEVDGLLPIELRDK
ncbi:MAG: SLATT domain-containing protein [Bacillota bacterium]|nr:SLATT domain-containing protein [Bacillota bacterium]